MNHNLSLIVIMNNVNVSSQSWLQNLVTIPFSVAVWNTLLYIHTFNWEDSKLLVVNIIIRKAAISIKHDDIHMISDICLTGSIVSLTKSSTYFQFLYHHRSKPSKKTLLPFHPLEKAY